MKSLFVFSCSVCLLSAAYAVDISNLPRCIEDIKKSMATAPQEPIYFTADYYQLLQVLQSPIVRESLPAVYQQNFFDPFLSYLYGMGASQFYALFSQQPWDEKSAFLQQIIPDITEAILQTSLHFSPDASNAFEEVVSDLYDGFLHQEDRRSQETGVRINYPDRGWIAPLIKWGNPQAGPYTWPVSATSELNIQAAVVSLPPAHLKGGLLAWSTLGHETGGHDILHADTGLLEELGETVYNAVIKNLGGNTFLANYWKGCIDETASDVLGLLNMGPTTGVGLVGYFRGLGGKLRSQGTLADPHPLDILRGFLAVRVVSQLSFKDAAAWSQAIEKEVNKDLQTIYLFDPQSGYHYKIPTQQAIQSAQIVADAILHTKLHSLEGHSLKEIQDWTDDDQKIVDELAVLLHKGGSLTPAYKNNGYYATHVVAAAIQEALKKGANVQTLFNRMIKFLDVMHQYNDTWKSIPSGVRILPFVEAS